MYACISHSIFEQQYVKISCSSQALQASGLVAIHHRQSSNDTRTLLTSQHKTNREIAAKTLDVKHVGFILPTKTKTPTVRSGLAKSCKVLQSYGGRFGFGLIRS